MKTLKYILPLCCVALASCSDLNVETPAVEETREVKTVLTAVIGSGTKTVLGDKNESGEYPVSWSALDKINVNGCESTGIVLNSGSATANFSFTDEMTAPYRAIYPASAYGSETVVSIPGNQTYKAGTFDECSAVLYAYSTAGSRLVFHQLMSYLKLSFNTEADPDNIKTIVVKSKGVEPMSGDFNFDFTALSPALSPMPEALVGSVTVDCGEDGVALGTDVIVAIPAQKYASGIEITTTDVNGDKTVHVLNTAFTAHPGTIYPMPITFEFYPGTRKKPVKVHQTVGGIEKDVLWAPVYCGYSKEHPNGLLYQYGRAKGQPYYPASGSSAIVKVGPVQDPDDGYFYKGSKWYSGTALTSWPMSESEIGYVEGKIANPCPEGWRLPTTSEFQGLLDIGFTQSENWAFSYSDKWTESQQNASVVKAGFTLKDGSGLFFAAVGGRTSGGLSFYRSNGEAYARIWASDRNNSDMTKASCLSLQRIKDSVAPDGFTPEIRSNYAVAGGISVRCVKEQ